MIQLCVVECIEYLETVYSICDVLQNEVGLEKADIGLIEKTLDDFTFDTAPDVEIRCKDYQEFSI